MIFHLASSFETTARIASVAIVGCLGIAASAAQASGAEQAGPTYISDPAQSRLEYSGTQAGAEFKARFKSFSTTLILAADKTTPSHIEVRIDLNSLDSKDGDRDKTMRGADFFDVAHTPVARYVTTAITKTAAGFSAAGSLTLRGVTKPVPITFKYMPAAAGATLEGDAKVQRLDFGVGQGEWKSTEWVGNEVRVHFALALKAQ